MSNLRNTVTLNFQGVSQTLYIRYILHNAIYMSLGNPKLAQLLLFQGQADHEHALMGPKYHR